LRAALHRGLGCSLDIRSDINVMAMIVIVPTSAVRPIAQ